MKPIFSCTNVNQEFEKFKLQDISFELEPGTILGVIGKNGCGKTTLLNTLMGLLSGGSSDDININGFSLETEVEEYKRSLAYVFNESPFPADMSSIKIGKYYGRYYESFDMNKYVALLEEYGICKSPDEYKTVKQSKENYKKINNLSQGMMIRQQLAFALSYDAKVYFMDEPTGNLDVEFRDKFYETIRALAATEEKSVIYASHLIEEMENFADYILWLKEENGVSTAFYFGTLDDLRDRFRIIEAGSETLKRIPEGIAVGGKITDNHSELLIDMSKVEREGDLDGIRDYIRMPELKEIMYYVEKNEVIDHA